MDIRKKMAKGAFWLFLEKGAQQISSFVVFAIIARLIGPEEYGLVALCGIVIILMQNVSTGMVDAVISMRIRDDERLSSLFWTIAAGGAVLSGLAFALAEPFAALFDQEKLGPLLRTFAVLPFLSALVAVPTALITATMNFKIFTIRTLIASFAGGIVGVMAALQGWGASALAAQQITAQIIIIAVVWISLGWRPRLVFKPKALGEMLKLGSAQTTSLFVGFFNSQAPRFALGLFLGPAAVGYYAFVLRVCGAIQDGVIQPVLNVVYPAIAEIISDDQKKLQIIQQTNFLVGALLFPIAVGVFLTVEDLIPLIFGEKWAGTNTSLKIYVLAMFFLANSIILRNVLRAHRQIVAYLKVQASLVLISTAAYFLTAPLGLEFVVMINVAVSVFTVLACLFLVRQKTGLSLFAGYRALWSPLLASALMGAGVYALQSFLLAEASSLLRGGASVLSGAVMYGVSLGLLEREKGKKIVSWIMKKALPSSS